MPDDLGSSKTRISEDLEIDPNALDIEWLRQASMYFKYAWQAAEARKEMDKDKLNLDVTLAQVSCEVREDPKTYGLEKVTEAALDSVVKRDSRVLSAQKSLVEAKHYVALLESAVAAFDHKKRALEHLVQLHLGSYFAGPKIPHELSQDSIKAWKKERAQSRITKAINKGEP